jgi:branched-subunit amino acid aminotransferase/4-amino-4-deoxychorismate lyase
VQGGDACWEVIRLYRDKILLLEEHLDSLLASADVLGFGSAGHIVHSRAEIKEAIIRTLAANGMRDGVLVRVTLSRGEKTGSSMNPAFNVYGTTLIVLPEYKTVGSTKRNGISLITGDQRCPPPACINSIIRHTNMVNHILPKIQANEAKADDALMLDINGFVSQTNAASVFMVKSGVLMTPPGFDVTRSTVIKLAVEAGIEIVEKLFMLEEMMSADEVFTACTSDELIPVTMIDGQEIGCGDVVGEVTKQLVKSYQVLPERIGFVTDMPPFV